MYSWSDDTSDWASPGAYKYSDSGKAERDGEARRAAAAGPRQYDQKRQPDLQLTDPKARYHPTTKNPLVIAVDVTGSMSTWPAEIFDRLPLLYNTLMQYRGDLEISFAAIGDAAVDRWPLQVTSFAKGFDLEQNLKGIYGEGGGGDAPESYGLFAWWLNNHVSAPNGDQPFVIVFGDITMHPTLPAGQIRHFLGDDDVQQDADSIATWREIARRWNTWFLRKAGGVEGDAVDEQWGSAIGEQKIVHIHDSQRAVDYAMGLVARSWGHFGDFRENMAARQDGGKIEELRKRIEAVSPRILACPNCKAPIPPDASGRFTCGFCKATISF